MSREHGAYHFEEESQNFLRKPSSSNQYTRFWTYISKREIDPILIIIGLLLGILLTLCVIAIIGLFHHVFFHQSRQLEVKLEESQLNGDELMKCKNLTYKVYTKPDLEATIDKSIIGGYFMNNETTGVVVDLLLEALNKFTTFDLKIRKRYDICKYVTKSLDMKYERDWACVFGDFETFIDRPEDGEYIFFQLDNYDGVEIFRAKLF